METPIPINKIGITVTDGGRHGTFIASVSAAIKMGATAIELSISKAGPGAEGYGKEPRRALKELSRVNHVPIVAVHVPPDTVENLSGFMRGGFVDEKRNQQVNSAKTAINFVADVANNDSAIVMHVGEFHRLISDQPWSINKQGKPLFKAYDEEFERGVIHLVNRDTGQIVKSLIKSQRISSPVWNKHEGKSYVDNNGNTVKHGDYINYESCKISRTDRVPKYNKSTGTFIMKDKTWNDFVKDAKEMNLEFKQKNGFEPLENEIVTAGETFCYGIFETQRKIAIGYIFYYGNQINKLLQQLDMLGKVKIFYDKLEQSLPEQEKWRLMLKDPVIGGVVGQLIPSLSIMPSVALDRRIQEVRDSISSSSKLVVAQQQEARKQQLLKEQTISMSKYALNQTIKSFVELGIYAMQISHREKKIFFLAPENISPESGYGSHPNELIALVKMARNAMADYLIRNRNMSESKAKMEAKEHIKATLDTGHLGLWRKYFLSKSWETKRQTDERFNDWYMEQIRKMAREDIVNHIHLVNNFGMTDVHLADGALPIKDAIKYLIERGYKGSIVSEAFGENVFGNNGRQLTKAWKNLGVGVSDMEHWFGKTDSPKFIFGENVPSNDWKPWSGIPLE